QNMRNKRKHNLLAPQIDPDGIQNNDLLQTYINPTSNKDSKPCRLEYLKKLYYFAFTEDDGEHVISSNTQLSEPDTDNLLGNGIEGDDFCEKYCLEKTICSGRVIVLFPRNVIPLPGNEHDKPPVNLADVTEPDANQPKI